MEYEASLQSIDQLAKKWASRTDVGKENEATTRFQYIDELLEKCLAWPKHQIRVEVHQEGEYTDYELGDGSTLVVVEAKREGVSFELPVGFKSSTASLATLNSLSAPIKDAVNQALGYATGRGIPICVVANGFQLVTFLGSRTDGVAPTHGRALIFGSLEAMANRFKELWDCLSPEGVRDGRLSNLLKETPLPAPPKKLSERIHGYPGFKNRNAQATELQILGDLFLEDIVRSPEVEQSFLEEAYCQSGALSQYALVSKTILSARYSAAFDESAGVDSEPVYTKKGLAPSFTEDALSASLNRRPILLVGDVGAGKSIFIRHLIRVQAKDILSQSIVLYVDFGSQPAFPDKLNEYIINEIDRQLLDSYQIDIQENGFVRGVHRSDLQRFSGGINKILKESDPKAFSLKELAFLEGLMADKEGHLKASVEHLVKGRKKQVVIFLDNVDQRPFEFQEQAFLVSQSLAERWPVTVFVSLRPETFNLSKSEGALAAYHPKVFTISPPRVDHVLSARIFFAVKLLETSGRLPWFPQGLNVKSDTLTMYMRMLLTAFDKNDQIIEFVDNMSGGNVRLSLDFVSTFVGSGHVDTRKILEALKRDNRYDLPIHEFMRAVIFGDHSHYTPSDSPIPNILDVSTTDPKEHFILAILTSYVHRHGKIGGADGYVAHTDVVCYLQHLGFHPKQIDFALTRAIRHNLVALPEGPKKEGGDLYRITTIGAYSTERLMSSFSYIDAIIIDTPILSDLSSRISDTDSSGILRDRLDRTIDFVEYLDECWSGFESPPSEIFDWKKCSISLKESIDQIRHKQGIGA